MKSSSEVIGILIKGSKECLNISGAWGRVWNTTPAYILSAIPIINGIFISFKAKQVESMASSSTLFLEHRKISDFTRVAQEVTGYTFFTALCIGVIQTFREINVASKMQERPWMRDKHQILPQEMRPFAVFCATLLGVFLCASFVESRLLKIKETYLELGTFTFNYRLRSAKNVDEAKAIIDFFESTSGNIESIEINGIDDLEIVKYLVEEKGANVNANTAQFYNRPLHDVKSLEVAKYLIFKGADINALNYRKCTPLTNTRNSLVDNTFDVRKRMEILLDCGADPNYRDGNGKNFFDFFQKLKQNSSGQHHFAKILEKLLNDEFKQT